MQRIADAWILEYPKIETRHGKMLEAVTNDTDRDHFMSAEEAKSWGIVDKVL